MNLNLLQSLCGLGMLLAQNMAYVHSGGCLQCALALLNFQYGLTESETAAKVTLLPLSSTSESSAFAFALPFLSALSAPFFSADPDAFFAIRGGEWERGRANDK
jgi:hypothetical protein